MRKIAVVLWCMWAIYPLGAASVSFLVIETGLPPGIPENPYSVLWENCLLDVFFESGHIVSNAPLLQLGEKPSDGFPVEAQKDFGSAKEGGMMYFVVTIVDHPGNAVSMRLFNTQSQNMIQEQRYTRQQFRTAREEQDHIKRAIRTMVAQIRD